ncbi:MAG TPA: sulfotransferase [Vicinamibacterales bacterium]|nr:sulfotransferase [Vicinamibacterales bacterium]
MPGTPATPLRVVYLAGSGHTGSTLLALFVDAHPRIVSVGETSLKRKAQWQEKTGLACTCGDAVQDCPFWQEVFQGVTAAGFELNMRHWSNDFRYKNPVAHKLLSRRSANPLIWAVQRSAGAIVPGHRARVDRVRKVNVAFIRTVMRVAGANVFFDTSKRAFRLQQLLETPELDVSVVKLVRDVRGYVASAVKRGDSLRDAALTWRRDQESVAAVTRALPANRVLTVRYEDLCRDPRTWLRQIYAFCGVEAIEPPEFVVSREHHVIGNSMRLADKIQIRLNEGWRTALSMDDQSRALAIAGPLHANLGYAGH